MWAHWPAARNQLRSEERPLPPEPPERSAPPLPPWVDDGTSWVPRRPTSRVYFNDSFVLPPLQPAPQTTPPSPERPRLRLVPPPQDAPSESSEWPEEARYCEACGRVDASDESGVFRRNAGEGYDPQDER